jgi:serine/threonine protein phosphatase PrpC
MDLGHLDCDGLSERGQVRAVNDDQFIIAELRKSMVVHRSSGALGAPSPRFGDTLGRLLLVADTGGDTADAQVSALAVQTIADDMLNIMPWFYRLGGPQEDDFLQELVSALKQCHTRIQAVADASPGAPEVGVVVTMAYVTWPWVYVIHVGNCRCYLQRDTALEQITTDHTLAQQLVDSGVLPAHEGATSRLSTVLWNALGGGLDDLQPEVYKARLHAGDTLLLCTDGLPKHVPDADIRALLQAREPARATCRRLVESANRGGGTDNITVIVARLGDLAPDTVVAEEAAAPTAVTVATPVPAGPESPAVPAAWTKDDAAGVLRGGSQRTTATRSRQRPAAAGQIREAPGRDAPDLRVAGPDLLWAYRGS